MGKYAPISALRDAGVSVWLDDLSRDRLTSGDLAELVRDWDVTGVTTNPTIFAAAVRDSDAYTAQLHELAARAVSVDDAVREITVTDVRNACQLMAGVWETSAGIDGRVSLEVDPRLAHDTAATSAQALELWTAVNQPNLLIKIPATEQGLDAISNATSAGVNVNVTLIFSVERYRQVLAAYMDGLERAAQTGRDLTTIHSVASFFISRVDTEIDARLTTLAPHKAPLLRGQAGIANARLAHAEFLKTSASPRWTHLATHGAHPQRPLWASTGVKNNAYPDTLYVTELVTAGTINTMPEATLRAFAHHGKVTGDRVTEHTNHAHTVFNTLTTIGIDLNDVFTTLEHQGITKFTASWTELTHTIAKKLNP